MMNFGLGLGLSLGASGGAGEVVTVTPDLQSIVTDVSATPTTVAVTLGSGQTGLRVFSGEPAPSEGSYDLYVSKNGGAVVKVRLYRWLGRILAGVAGDTFALGTTDGRTLSCASMTAPGSLTAPSGATGTANCDKAGPPLWEPTAAHVTLTALDSAFTVTADGTERWVFISELSPQGWTPYRAFRHSATRSISVRCNYKQIALANYAGATLSITAPTGATIGGTSVTMALPFPAVTGTSHVCTTGLQFATAIGVAVAGDEIVVSGAITLTGEVTRASFVANELLGNKGYESIVIRGVTTGDRTSGTISSGGFGWTVNMPGAGDTMTAHGYMKDLTWDFGANAKLFSHGGGKYRHQNVRCTAGTGDTWDVNATNYPVVYDALYCRSDTSGDDCWNFSGNATYNGASRIRLIDCEGVLAGNNANSQCLTSHVGLPFETYGGTFSDALTSAVANDATTTPGYLFFSTISAGTRAAGITNGIELFGCAWTGGTAGANPVVTRFGRLTTTIGSTATLLRNTALAEHNIIAVTGGRAIFNSLGGARIFGNIITANEGVRLGSAAGAVASTNVLMNTFTGGDIGFSSQDVANMPSVLKSNAATGNTTSVNVVTGGTAAVTGDYNTLDPTVDADYTAGANDTTGSNAALESDLIPTASGNCDGNGDTSIVDYVGDSDPFGFVLIYKASRVSRGARDIPAVYASAVLHPDLF